MLCLNGFREIEPQSISHLFNNQLNTVKVHSIARSRDHFVHYLATALICRGYWFYICGRIPAGKDREAIDQKLIEKYDCNNSKNTRWRRKKAGKANVRYFRWDRFFVLMATKGEHKFFEQEADIKDIRKVPIKVGGYSISFRRDGRPRSITDHSQYRVHVRIETGSFKELVARFDHIATRMSANRLGAKLYEIPFRGYAPIRHQLCQLLKQVNRKRRRSGLSQLPREVLHFDRRLV